MQLIAALEAEIANSSSVLVALDLPPITSRGSPSKADADGFDEMDAIVGK